MNTTSSNINTTTTLDSLNSTDGAGDDDGSAPDSATFGFIFEGLLLTLVTAFGLVANAIAVVILVRPKMRSSFHFLLVALSVFDMLYLMMSQMIFGFPSLSEWYKKNVYIVILPICFGLAHIGRVGSVYLTMSVTIER